MMRKLLAIDIMGRLRLADGSWIATHYDNK